jgi:hypothetical protein
MAATGALAASLTTRARPPDNQCVSSIPGLIRPGFLAEAEVVAAFPAGKGNQGRYG